MKKKLIAVCLIFVFVLNIMTVAVYLFQPTTGIGKTGALKWTKKTEEFVENTFGHYDTDEEKVIAFKEWVIQNIAYTPYRMPLVQMVDIDETIESKQGICFEQASVFTVFCRISGIECYNVDGRSKKDFFSAHTWNRYRIGNQWYEIDITHDQTVLKTGRSPYGTKELSALDAPDATYNIYRIY